MLFDNFNHNRCYVITFIFSTINEIEIPKLKLFFGKCFMLFYATNMFVAFVIDERIEINVYVECILRRLFV